MARVISNRIKVAVISMMLACFISGCICSIGGSEGRCDEPKQCSTTGQELIDLKKALDQEAISVEEYNQKKRQILRDTK